MGVQGRQQGKARDLSLAFAAALNPELQKLMCMAARAKAKKSLSHSVSGEGTRVEAALRSATVGQLELQLL